MNGKLLLDLTYRLNQALDQNYDVINMEVVKSVISALEGTTITKEQLETTRLAKFINQLRRRTKDEQLARRAKTLLKTWREMVGIQQNTNEQSSNSNAAVLTNDIAVTTQIRRLRSLPTSPTITAGIHLENAINSKVNPNIEYSRSNLSNHAPTASCLTKSANLNVHNFNKRLDIIAEGQNVSYTSNSAVPTISGKPQQQPPTSFANLITGFCRDNNNQTSATNELIITSQPVGRKFIKSHGRSMQPMSQTFVLDQSSNSNSDISYLAFNKTTNATTPAPIVIDIQDSNSGSNLIAPTDASKISVSSPVSSNVPMKISSPASSTKAKKSKKEKKRKEQRDNQMDMPAYSQNSMVVIDETCSNQQPKLDATDSKFGPMTDEKSRLAYGVTNISEILSLSNSSISSMFPSETVNAKEEQKKNTSSKQLTVKPSSSTADLTFAGKFKTHNSSAMEHLCNNKNSKVLGVNGAETSTAALNRATAINKFTPFSGVVNSNDSSSNSHVSQFDIVDIVSPDNRVQTKSNDALPIKVVKKSPEVKVQVDQLLPPVTKPADVVQINGPPAIDIEKIPKKRGRKKGSKGVDAVIAKENKLTCKMLISQLSGGGKRVKTTKELYAEMQNRKLGITTATPSPTQLQMSSRPESSCSEPSLHSPRTLDACSTNATPSAAVPEKPLTTPQADEPDSYTDTNTSEPSRDSYTAPATQRNEKWEKFPENNSNSQLPSIAEASTITDENILSEIKQSTLASAEQELREYITLRMPPVPKITDIELECAADQVVCTCIVKEELPINFEPIPEKVELKSLPKTYSIPDCTSAAEIVLSQKTDEVAKEVEKPKKSIFDLDFEDDEDPLHQIIAEAAAVAASKNQNANETTEGDETALTLDETSADYNTKDQISVDGAVDENLKLPPTSGSNLLSSQTQSVPVEDSFTNHYTTPVIQQVFPYLVVEEDPNCAAKKRFEDQTQKITKFHVDTMHNYYIPNVNGNWDHADSKFENLDAETEPAWDGIVTENKSIVPKYCTFMEERLAKNLSDWNLTKSVKIDTMKSTKLKNHCDSIPFMGVARKIYKSKKQKKLKTKLKRGLEDPTPSTIINMQIDTLEQDVKLDPELKAVEGVKLDSEEISEMKTVVKLEAYESKIKQTEEKTAPESIKQKNDELCEVIFEDGYDNKSFPNNVTSNCNLLTEEGELAFADMKAVEKSCVNDKSELDGVSNNNNVVFKDITIDVADNYDDVYGKLNEADRLSTGLFESPNLLAIAKNDNYKSDAMQIAIPNDTTASLDNGDFINTEIIELDSDDNNSRRSSSCSNTSLQKTTQSINLRLRRRRDRRLQRKLQNEQKLTLRCPQKRKRKSRNDENDSSANYKKPRIIKIAINGDIATQRQLSQLSSNSTDEEYDNEYNDDEMESEKDEDTFKHNEENPLFINHSDSSSNSDLEEVGEPDEENDVDEYDDEEDYTGDYHEVVTRDISASTTGNNHIVLTIKKTPSKTNSPSNSLSAMSPLISTPINIASNSSTLPPAAAAKITELLEPSIAAGVDVLDDLKIETETEVGDSLQIGIVKNRAMQHDQDQNKSKDHLEQKGNAPITNSAMKTCEGETKQPNEHIEHSNGVTCPIDRENCRKHRRLNKSKRSSGARKSHRELFNSYELYSVVDGVRQSLFSISSCSSSCDEDNSDVTTDLIINQAYREFGNMTDSSRSCILNNTSTSSSDISSDDNSDSDDDSSSTDSSTSSVESMKRIKSDDDSHSFGEIKCDTKIDLATNLKQEVGVKLTNNNGINNVSISDNRTELENGIGNRDEDGARLTKEINDTPAAEPAVSAVVVRDYDQLPAENNGLLLSFNQIYYDPEEETLQSSSERVEESDADMNIYTTNANPKAVQQQEQEQEQLKQRLPNKNCDDYNNLYNNNNNNLNLTKNASDKLSIENMDSCINSCRKNSCSEDGTGNSYSAVRTGEPTLNAGQILEQSDAKNSSAEDISIGMRNMRDKQLIPRREYQTGLRAVDEDVNDDNGNNCARIQEFKEWHQVLHLRSYNDELLTVMPYVVLE